MSESSQRHKNEAPTKIQFSLIMCSTSRYNSLKKGEKTLDKSGNFIAEAVSKAGYTMMKRILVPDNEVMIRNTLKDFLESDGVDIVILCGGTGISQKDVTIETVRPMLRKILPGFGELFRLISYKAIGSATILSRAIAGVSKNKAIFCIPGSINAVKLSLDKLILPEAAHIVKHARENHD